MEQKIINDLQAEVENLTRQIGDLEHKKETVLNCIKVFSDTEVSVLAKPVSKAAKKELKVKAPIIPRKVNKLSKDGKLKFSQGVLRIFEQKPDKVFYSKDLVEIMTRVVENGEVQKPNKEMVSAVSAYLWNFAEKRGILVKIKEEGKLVGFKYNGKDSKKSKKDEPSLDAQTNELDEVILEKITAHKKLSLPDLVSKIRVSEEYGHIAKGLNGTLAACVENAVRALTEKDMLIWNSDNQYELNSKGHF